MNYGDAIQNRLVGLATGFQFPVVSYTPSPTGAVRVTSTTTTVRPAAAIAWAESALFDEAVNHRRTSDRREVLGWIWRLQVQFNTNVSLEEFERTLLTNIPRIDRALPDRELQVDLLLEEAEYQNPVTQQPSQGLRVTYRFTARLTPT